MVFHSLFLNLLIALAERGLSVLGSCLWPPHTYDPVLFSCAHTFIIFPYKCVEVWKDTHHSFKRGW